MTSTTPTPIIVLTGFLGAGKSTLLRRLLAEPAFANSGLIINEFGDVAIDHDLVTTGRTPVAVTSTGCLCCTAGSDIRASIAELHDAAKAAGRLPLDRVVIETTGLADMAPVVNQLVAGAVPAFGLRDHTVARHYRLAGVATVFDAQQGRSALDRHPECVKQVAFADRIFISKLDLLDERHRAARLAETKGLIHNLSPSVPVTAIDADGFDLAAAFAPQPYAPQDLGPDVADWLNEAADEQDHAHVHHSGHDHAHHHGGEAQGAFGIGTFAIVRDAPVDKDALAHAVDLAGLLYGSNLLRLKGIVGFADEPDTPYVVQVVQHVVHPLHRLVAWPSADRRTKLVAITHDVNPADLERLLTSILNGTGGADTLSEPETVRL